MLEYNKRKEVFMQQNILKNSDITKIYLTYINNGLRKKESVKLRFMDDKQCYFSIATPAEFVKPKRKAPAELQVYTPDGVYKTSVIIVDTNVGICEILFEVTKPKTWNYVQVRNSSRKLVELPVTIAFNDGFKIEATTYDLALNGVSFFYKEEISSIYKKINGILVLKLPSDTLINFANGALTVETKFVREKGNVEGLFNEKLYVFKFIGISMEDEAVLRNFLIKLN